MAGKKASERIILKQVILREVRQTDLDDLQAAGNDKAVSKYLNAITCPFTKADAQRLTNQLMKAAQQRPRTSYDLVIEHKKDKRAIGLLRCFLRNDGDNGSVAYWLGKPHWGKGIMSEALPAFLEFLFKSTKVRRLTSFCFVENTASVKLLERNRFVREGMYRKGSRSSATGKLHDEYIYGLLRDEWKKRS